MSNNNVLINNRKARHSYIVLETYEAGIALKGTEVKSLRNGKGNLNDSFAKISNGEVLLHNLHISPYEYATSEAPDPVRTRKLLLHKNEIKKLLSKLSTGGKTLIPLKLYLKNGKVKVLLGFVKGKRQFDKRESIKNREINRKIRRRLGRNK